MPAKLLKLKEPIKPKKPMNRKGRAKTDTAKIKCKEVNHLILSPYVNVGPVTIDIEGVRKFFREFQGKLATERAAGIRH